jgi:hypothetical protein
MQPQRVWVPDPPEVFLPASAVAYEQLQANSKLNCDGVASAGGIRVMGFAAA